jgi:hypothetical protein
MADVISANKRQPNRMLANVSAGKFKKLEVIEKKAG